MRNMLRAGALALALLPGVAFGQSSVLPYYYNAGGVKTPVGSSNPLPVSASVSASISGFPTVQTTGTPISVTTGGVTGTLPAGAVVVASNVGTTNAAYCKLGASATTSDQYIAPSGGWFAFTVGANTQLTCITSTSTTTVNMVGGSGLPTGTGGGSGGGGGGGAVTIASSAVASGAYSSGSIASGAYASGSIGSGAVASGAYSSGAFASGAYASGSIGSGAMVDLGAIADAAATTGSTGTLSAKLRLMTSQLDNINTSVQAAIPAGSAIIGKVGIDQTTPGTTNGTVQLAAAVGGSSTTGNIAANNTTAVVVKASAGTLYGAQLYGIGSAPAYLKIYNATSATCGSGTPVKRLMIPAASTAALGDGSNVSFGPTGIAFGTGITYCVTTGITDADTTAPAASTFLVNLDWQ